jgi:mono/diheme cytochrome c family protein
MTRVRLLASASLGAALIFTAGAPAFSQQGPTYSQEISRIFQAKCQTCHRDGDIAPFALATYDDAVTWAQDIQTSITNGTMPPWKPVPGYGDFKYSLALTADEKQQILDWIGNGTPQGDPANLPDPVTDTGPWPLGQPDLVLQAPQPYTPPRGTDVYRCFVLPDTGLTQTTYLSALDLLPGNRQIVHHAIIFIDTTGTAAKMDGADGQPGYTCFGGPGIPVDLTNIFGALDALGGVGGWAPGSRGHYLPDGVGIMIPAGARLVMQIHYYPSAGTGPDQTSLGLYFATSQIQKRLYQIPIINDTFTVQPNTVKDVVGKFPPIPLPLSAKAITVFPHMHLLGRQIKIEMFDQQGNVTPMIYENNWEFNWQGSYTFKDPLAIPAYSTVKVTCTFDNTTDNPKNPNNPPIAVSWGERTTDEMCVGFVGVTLDVDPFTIMRTLKPAQ